ncbi:hypothetical protein AHV58_13285 [Salmonella enterica subsp. enterica]|nr:hypothetical protein [Salmonella enterica subsp. enterica]
MLISILSILMDNQALRQLNPGFVQRAGSWIKHLPRLFSLCVLILETGCRSWCRVATECNYNSPYG